MKISELIMQLNDVMVKKGDIAVNVVIDAVPFDDVGVYCPDNGQTIYIGESCDLPGMDVWS